MIDSLRWEDNLSVQRPLKEGEVAVKPHTVGVNFRDVLQTQGVVDGDDLGGEFSGTVLKVGPGVAGVTPGDRVFMTESYRFLNKFTTNQELLAHIPKKFSMKGAATMPTVFTTVIYALLHLRPWMEGQTILIHSDCSRVGISFFRIASPDLKSSTPIAVPS